MGQPLMGLITKKAHKTVSRDLSQNNLCLKIVARVVSRCHITEIVVSDYDFKFFQKVKAVVKIDFFF